MIKQLFDELRRATALALDRWRVRNHLDQVTAATRDLGSQYRQRSLFSRLFLIAIVVVAAVAVLVAVANGARTSPNVARTLFLPVPVAGYRAQIGRITDIVGASGIVQEHATVAVTSRINSTVQAVPIKIGDVITKDTTLLNADQSIYKPALVAAQQAALAAKANVAKFDGQFQATEELARDGLASDLDVQEALAAQASARQAQAESEKSVAESQNDLDFTGFKSPLNCIVIACDVNPGDSLIINRPVFTLGVLDTVYFVALVQENELPFLAANARAEIIFSSLPSQTFKGVIEKIDPTIDSTTRTFKAYIAIDNPGLRLKPGITGFGRVTIERTGLAIPESAVMNQYGDTANVFVINQESRAVLTPVVLGLSGQNNYEVLSGLKEGDVVVSAGTLYLKDNERVHVNFPRDQTP